MKYLWIGVGNSEEGRAHILKNGGKLLSAEISNDALVAGLDANGVFCDMINSSRIAAYPKYPEKRIKPYTWTTANGAECQNVGYLNLKYINLLSKKKSLVKAAREWAKKHKNEDVTVFVYQMHTPFMAAASAVKKLIPNAKFVLIVPDLPQFMDMNMSRLKKTLKAIDWKNIRKLMKSVDKYILYSKHMAEYLCLADGTWTVMEGSYDASLLVEDKDVQKNESKISVMYSGVLDLRYGIRELLDAFEHLDGDYELWLTGNGNAVPLINERAEKDERIKFYGYLPSRYELLKKQREATMLISTRDPSEQASAYCFPSKIFEYMVSGNPVISTEIKGIPDEYFDYLVPLKTISPEEIAGTIKKVADMDAAQRKAVGDGGRRFILEKKNNVAQAKKMIEFVE
ncbi:MAG: glycosyltransferase family 4 protein [Ruminococcaceae bacterium]|nr:glycosyltransferase family 4 protein [Oscillospiraceae bacterium]